MRIVALALCLCFLPSLVSADTGRILPRLRNGRLHENRLLLGMLRRSNDLRSARNLTPHAISPELTKAAQDQAEYMARTASFSHYNNGGPGGRAARHGFNGSARENIAMGYATVDVAFVGWRNSGGHYASIVSNTTHAGFGYAESEGGTPYYVGVYGTPAPPASEADSTEGSTAASSGTTNYSNNYNTSRRRRHRRRR